MRNTKKIGGRKKIRASRIEQEPVSWDGVGKRITLVVANSE